MCRKWTVVTLLMLLCFSMAIGEEKTKKIRLIQDDAQELNTQLDLLNCIINSTSDAVYVKNTLGQYTMFNTAAETFVGKSAEEVMGHDDYFIFSPDEAKTVMENDRKIFEGFKPTTYEEYVTTASGRKTTFLSTKGPLFNPKGEVIYTGHYPVDFSNFKKMNKWKWNWILAPLGEAAKDYSIEMTIEAYVQPDRITE